MLTRGRQCQNWVKSVGHPAASAVNWRTAWWYWEKTHQDGKWMNLVSWMNKCMNNIKLHFGQKTPPSPGTTSFIRISQQIIGRTNRISLFSLATVWEQWSMRNTDGQERKWQKGDWVKLVLAYGKVGRIKNYVWEVASSFELYYLFPLVHFYANTLVEALGTYSRVTRSTTALCPSFTSWSIQTLSHHDTEPAWYHFPPTLLAQVFQWVPNASWNQFKLLSLIFKALWELIFITFSCTSPLEEYWALVNRSHDPSNLYILAYAVPFNCHSPSALFVTEVVNIPRGPTWMFTSPWCFLAQSQK